MNNHRETGITDRHTQHNLLFGALMADDDEPVKRRRVDAVDAPVVGPVVGPRPSGPSGSERMRAAEAAAYAELRAQQQAPPEREAWMTALPEGKRQDALAYFRGGKTSFSAKGVQGDVDKGWMATPGASAQAASREAREEAEREEAKREAEARHAAEVKARLDAYTATARPTSLLELHLTGEADAGKDKHKKKKDKHKKKKKGKKEVRCGPHAPLVHLTRARRQHKSKRAVPDALPGLQVGAWDREGAMGGAAGLSTAKKVATIKGAQQLHSRFGSGGY